MTSNNTLQSLTGATEPVCKSGQPAVTGESDLSQPEADLLQQLKSVVHRGKKVFIEVGTALFQIREYRLYRSEFKTFEEFCQSEFGFTRQFASLQIQSAEIASGLSTTVDIPNETTAREFISVPAEDRSSVAEQAKAIAAEHGRDTINSRDVKEAKGKRKSEPDYHCRECNQTFTEAEGDCPRCYPPEPETVLFDPDFESVFKLCEKSIKQWIFDARSYWTPEQQRRLFQMMDDLRNSPVPPEYLEA